MKSPLRNMTALAVVLALLVMALALLSTEDEGKAHSRRHSSYNAGPLGVKAFYLLLKESGLDVIRWRKEAERLPVEEKILYISVAPAEPFSSEEIEFLYDKVSAGSTWVLFCGASLENALSRMGMEANLSNRPPILRLQSTPGHAILHDHLNPPPAPDSAWADDFYYTLEGRNMQPIYGWQSRHFITEIVVDSGSVLVYGSPGFVTNAGVSDTSNLDAVLRLLMYDVQGRRRVIDRIVFDEFHQGFKEFRSMLAWLDDPAIKTGLVMGLVALLTWVYSRARRIGRAVPVLTRSRRSSREYVESVTDAFLRAGANSWVLQTWYGWVRRQLATSFHTNRNERIADQMSRRYGMKKEEVLALMDEVEKKLADADIAPDDEPVRKRAVKISDDDLVHLMKKLDELQAAHQGRKPGRKKAHGI